MTGFSAGSWEPGGSARPVYGCVRQSTVATPPGYRVVLRNLRNNLRHIPELAFQRLPTSSALTRARQRLGDKPLQALFERLSGPLATPDLTSAFAFGLRLVAWDGTALDVPDTPANAAEFGFTGKNGVNQRGNPKERNTARIPCARSGPSLVWVSVPNPPTGPPRRPVFRPDCGSRVGARPRSRVRTIGHGCNDSPRESGTNATTADASLHTDLLENVRPLNQRVRGSSPLRRTRAKPRSSSRRPGLTRIRSRIRPAVRAPLAMLRADPTKASPLHSPRSGLSSLP
jgi:hypothetical protein